MSENWQLVVSGGFEWASQLWLGMNRCGNLTHPLNLGTAWFWFKSALQISPPRPTASSLSRSMPLGIPLLRTIGVRTTLTWCILLTLRVMPVTLLMFRYSEPVRFRVAHKWIRFFGGGMHLCMPYPFYTIPDKFQSVPSY